MIFRPAPHIPVNALHPAQKPSRMATGSEVAKPQSGQVQPVAARLRCRRPRLSDALELLRDIVPRPFAHLGLPPTGQAPVMTARYDVSTRTYMH
jgi:hypothetical protein